jgi:hypothetical protein
MDGLRAPRQTMGEHAGEGREGERGRGAWPMATWFGPASILREEENSWEEGEEKREKRKEGKERKEKEKMGKFSKHVNF